MTEPFLRKEDADRVAHFLRDRSFCKDTGVPVFKRVGDAFCVFVDGSKKNLNSSPEKAMWALRDAMAVNGFGVIFYTISEDGQIISHSKGATTRVQPYCETPRPAPTMRGIKALPAA